MQLHEYGEWVCLHVRGNREYATYKNFSHKTLDAICSQIKETSSYSYVVIYAVKNRRPTNTLPQEICDIIESYESPKHICLCYEGAD